MSCAAAEEKKRDLTQNNKPLHSRESRASLGFSLADESGEDRSRNLMVTVGCWGVSRVVCERAIVFVFFGLMEER